MSFVQPAIQAPFCLLISYRAEVVCSHNLPTHRPCLFKYAQKLYSIKSTTFINLLEFTGRKTCPLPQLQKRWLPNVEENCSPNGKRVSTTSAVTT